MQIRSRRLRIFSRVSESRTFDSGGTTLADVGEDVLLGLLSAAAGAPSDPGVVVPSGDDAAVVHVPLGLELAVSQDALVEGKDFQRSWITPWQLGRRALAVALSDIAGMGGEPAWCTATICAPASTQLDDVLAIHSGLRQAAVDAGCPLVGGDVSDIDGPLVLDVAVGGTGSPGSWLLRDAGMPGDLLVVSGRLGRAAAGLQLLLGAGVHVGGADRAAWLTAFLAPVPRVSEGRLLSGAGVRCGGDVSDGLLIDARRTAAASGCAAELWLDTIPVDAALRVAFGDRWPDLALGGGEDFELLAAASADRVDALLRGWPGAATPLTVVGRLVPGSEVQLLSARGGEVLPPPRITARHYL